jgi:predicted regulator of Ras-like GTPase activity (Roadblock/LC7/MglB family)
MLAFQDGMPVAAEVPAGYQAETLAAFMPQIFGRMNQYAKEAGMGQVSNLILTTGNVQWQICQAGSVFFAAISKPGETMPSHVVPLIVEELQKQSKS